jgi:Xaa-Pro aminopeptidase
VKKAGIRIQQDSRVGEAFVEARFVKSPEELVLLEYASQLAAWVHQEAHDVIRKARVASG